MNLTGTIHVWCINLIVLGQDWTLCYCSISTKFYHEMYKFTLMYRLEPFPRKGRWYQRKRKKKIVDWQRIITSSLPAESHGHPEGIFFSNFIIIFSFFYTKKHFVEKNDHPELSSSRKLEIDNHKTGNLEDITDLSTTVLRLFPLPSFQKEVLPFSRFIKLM